MTTTRPSASATDAAAAKDRPSITSTQALIGAVVFSALFTVLVWAVGGRLDAVPLLPDQGAAWYYWKLPDPTWITRASAWLPYLLHQVALWWLIWRAQQERPRYGKGLHWFNWAALGVNAGFIVLHLIQTHVFYDGLAQDVSVFSSQGSVILLLVMVLIMESRRRGLAFGHPLGIPKAAIDVVKRYHGYVFAWAIIYTFWFHPLVSTPGHLFGLFYIFLIMVQSSLFFTRAHLNRRWTVLLEVLVLGHGAMVAYAGANGLWPMFAFGFGAIFVVTQMYGLGWPRWARWLTIAVFVGLVTLVYADRGWGKLNEIVRIPVIEYVLAILLAWLIVGGRWLVRRFRTSKPTPAGAEVAA
ncbi:MAG TPA: hypothetical protein PKM36_00495 [Propionibacteriaceae bacterium]|nr:hypothetical protein [Propionibacteriaceae bacterium]